MKPISAEERTEEERYQRALENKRDLDRLERARGTAKPVFAYTDVTCPFCGEGDFDHPGLKKHLLMGWCENFEKTEKV